MKTPPGAPVTGGAPRGGRRSPGDLAGLGVDRGDAPPLSSPTNSRALAPATDATKGTTGEREWATPGSVAGIQAAGQRPPKMPRRSEWTVRSLESAMSPGPETVGATTAVAPVA